MNSRVSYRIILFLLSVFTSDWGFSQQVEYRITEEGKYQYLSNQKEAGMVFDESKGTYYKDITARTFYLETYRKGILPPELTYERFTQLTVAEQSGLLNQSVKSYDCSSNNMNSECLNFHGNSVFIHQNENVRVVDLTPRCDPSKKTNMSLTSKIITNPNNPSLENTDCGDQQQKTVNQSAKSKNETGKIILNKE